MTDKLLTEGGMIDSVDVILLTKNSEKILEKCLTSVYENVPVNQLIVVDGCSTDKTLEILSTFDRKYHNVKITMDKGTRATAREKGIQQVKTDWFMFIDSDVVVCKNWYQKALKYLDKTAGGIWGTEVWSTIQSEAMLKVFLRVTRKIFDLRGGTHDTLIRTDLVKDIVIPKNLHVFEDAYIKEWITKKGYKVIAAYNPYCIHYRPKDVWTFRGSVNLIVDAVRFGSIKLLFKLVFAYGFYTAYSVFQLFSNNLKTHS
jgi:glycosyltransferase involved in cell wall biosynthesis